MKTFKRSILAVSLTMATWQQALPCWDYEMPEMYNHFHCVKEMPEIKDRHIDESVAFWAKYTGQPVTEEFASSVRYLSSWQLDDDETTNLLLVALKAQGKTEALNYLRLNEELHKLQDGTNSWDYHKATPAEYEALLKRIEALKVTGELSRRKLFLRMRCLFSLQDYQACLRLWNDFASKWEPSPLRDRMEGYVAGAYYRMGQYDRAIPMFFEMGDDGSIQLCVNRMLESTSIEQEYSKDPNSPLLGYILEDYANYYYHASKDECWSPGEDNPIWTVVTREAQRNITLAERVVREKKAKDLQMWQAFAGFLQLVNDQPEQAYQSFTKAEKLPGSGIVAPSLRAFKFVSVLHQERKPADFEQVLARELPQWLDNTNDNPAASLYTLEVKPYVLRYAESKGNTNLMLAARTALDPEEVHSFDHDVPLDQVIAARQYVQQSTTDEIEALFKRYSAINTMTDDTYHDLLGTKLLRLGRYDEALTHFSQVSLSHYRHMGVAPYLNSREMPPTGFDRVQYGEPDLSADDITVNKKLEFCQRLVNLQQTAAISQGDRKARAKVEMAKWLFQGSIAGDLWGMSEYWWSAYGANSNELNQQAIDCLHEALRSTHDHNILVECYYGLAANANLTSETPYDWNEERNAGSLVVNGEQYEAYKWLTTQSDRSHPIYQQCDWLDLYIFEGVK